MPVLQVYEHAHFLFDRAEFIYNLQLFLINSSVHQLNMPQNTITVTLPQVAKMIDYSLLHP